MRSNHIVALLMVIGSGVTTTSALAQVGAEQLPSCDAGVGPPKAFYDAVGANQTGQVGSALVIAISVRDRNCLPVVGQRVSWSVVSGGGSVSPSSSDTDANGQARTTITLGTTAGQQVFRASSGGVNNSPVDFTETAIAGPATTLIIGDVPSSTVGGAPFDVRVTARDQFGNVATGYRGTVAFSSSDNAASLPAAYAFVAGDAGVHLFPSGVTLNTAGTHSITVIDSANALSATRSGIAVQSRTLTATSGDAQSGVVDAALALPLTVRYLDGAGAPLVGQTITFASESGGAVSPASATTDTQGFASTTARLGTVAGAQLFTARSGDGLQASFNATASPGNAASLTITGAPAAMQAGESADLVVTARDAFGNRASGYRGTVRFRSTDAGATLPADFTFAAGDDGQHTFAGVTLRGAGAQSIAVEDVGDGALIALVNIDVFAAPPAALVVVSGDAQRGIAGELLAQPLVVRLQDNFGNAIADAVTTFAADSGGGSVTTPTAITDSDGRAATTATVGSVAGLANVFSASAAGLGASFSAAVDAGPAAALVLLGVPFSTQAGSAHDLRLEVRDAHGNLAVSYAGAVSFTSTDARATLPAPVQFTQSAVADLPAGLALRSAGVHTVRASDGTLSVISAESLVSAGPPRAISVVSGAGQSAVVNTALPQPIVVRVDDDFQNGVPGVSVAFSATNGSVTASATTDDNGQASATATLGTRAGASSFLGRAGVLEARADATATPDVPARFDVLAPAAAFIGEAALVGVEARDAFDNLATGSSAALTVSSSDVAAALPSTIALAAGVASFNVTFASAASHTISVSDGGLSGVSAAINVSERPPVPSVLVRVAGEDQRAVAGAPYAGELAVRVEDDRGRVVANAEVAFAVLSGQGSVSPALALTDDSGIARAVAVAGTRAGAESIGATLVGSNTSVTFPLTSLPGPAVAVEGALLAAEVRACSPASLTLTARDQHGNIAADPVDIDVDVASLTGAPVIVSATLQSAALGGASTSGALVGAAQIDVQLDAADDVFISWSASAISSAGVEQARFVPGPVSSSTSEMTASAAAIEGGGAAVTLRATPRDACGVGIGAGHTVTAAASYGTVSAVTDRGDGSYEASFSVGVSECRPEPASVVFVVDGALLDAQAAITTTCPAPTGPRIVTVPRPSAIVGVPYIVDVNRAFETDGAAAYWLKVEGPAELHIDPVTGFVGWVPARAAVETITISASNASGADELTYTVTVTDLRGTPPTPIIDVTPEVGLVGVDVIADATASLPGSGGPIASTTWDFGDGSPLVTGAQATHRYAQAQSYTVRVEVVDDSGLVGQAATTVSSRTADVLPPRARIISTPIEETDGRIVAELSCDCAPGSANIAAVHWDFGDGTVADADVVTQVFGPGGWTVRLTVIDDNGLVANDSLSVNVGVGGNRPPLVTSSASPPSGAAPLVVRFAAQYGDLDGTVADVRWDFGDGGSSTEPSPSYTFADAGSYRVALTVVDNAGLAAVHMIDVEVTAGDIAAPKILSLPATVAKAGVAYAYDDDSRAAARGARPLSWALGKRVGDELVGAPAGMTVDAFSGAISFTPTPEQVGSARVVLVAWNEAGTSSQEWDIEIAPPDPIDGPPPDVDPVTGEPPASCACGATARPTDAAVFALFALALFMRRRR